MHFILMLLLTVGGYHFVTKAIDERAQPKEEKVQVATSTDSLMGWVDSARSLLNGAKEQGASIADDATNALPAETHAKLSAAAKTAAEKIHLTGPGCGEPDRFGNLKYCFHDDKQ